MRTRDQLYEHYKIERELAERLINSDRAERIKLYSSLYDELFERVPHHPQLTTRDDHEALRANIELQMELLSKFLRPDVTFMEIGAGDCLLSFEAARHVKRVYAIDVSRKVSEHSDVPDNFKLIISNGISIDVPPGSIDIAYSNQVIEHLHPDDVAEHLKNVHDALVKGGKYICITPHRFMGPHDISRYFEKEAKGFHIHEYTNRELHRLFAAAGFSSVRTHMRVKGRYSVIPGFLPRLIESMLQPAPYNVRRKLSRTVFKNPLSIRLVAAKHNDI
jgi:SAM-dependent methyltransferase